MNKPLTMIVKETQLKLANICNESGLSPVILDLIVQGIYSEIHSLAEKQYLQEESAYAQLIENSDMKKDDAFIEGDTNESK